MSIQLYTKSANHQGVSSLSTTPSLQPPDGEWLRRMVSRQNSAVSIVAPPPISPCPSLPALATLEVSKSCDWASALLLNNPSRCRLRTSVSALLERSVLTPAKAAAKYLENKLRVWRVELLLLVAAVQWHSKHGDWKNKEIVSPRNLLLLLLW